MKTLYIVRHAKSSWEYPELSDDERPLLSKGVKRTNKIAAFLSEKNIRIEAFITSHAVRAHETAKIITGALDYPEDRIIISKQLYPGSTDHIYTELFGLSDDIQSVMIFGHNPAFTSFANCFLKHKIDWLPTSGVVAIRFITEKWTEISTAKHSTEFVLVPKDL